MYPAHDEFNSYWLGFNPNQSLKSHSSHLNMQKNFHGKPYIFSLLATFSYANQFLRFRLFIQYVFGNLINFESPKKTIRKDWNQFEFYRISSSESQNFKPSYGIFAAPNLISIPISISPKMWVWRMDFGVRYLVQTYINYKIYIFFYHHQIQFHLFYFIYYI